MKSYFFACFALTMVTACSAGGGGSLDSYTGMPSSGSGSEGSTDVSCTMISPPSREARIERVTTPADALTGGDLAPGRYVLTVVRVYGEDALISTSTKLSSAMVIGTGSSVATVTKTEKGVVQAAGRLVVSGGKLTGTMSCSNPPSKDDETEPGKASDYEASPAEITIRGRVTTVTTPDGDRPSSTSTTSETYMDMVYERE